MPNRAVHPRARSIFKARTKSRISCSASQRPPFACPLFSLCASPLRFWARWSASPRRLSIPRRRSISPRWMLRINFLYIRQPGEPHHRLQGHGRPHHGLHRRDSGNASKRLYRRGGRALYEHNGVDVKRIVGALVANFTSGSTQGGSTITQQLIKQTVLSSEQSYKRKLQEAYLAMELETRYTKKQILESYRTPSSSAAAITACAWRPTAISASRSISSPCANVPCSPG